MNLLELAAADDGRPEVFENDKLRVDEDGGWLVVFENDNVRVDREDGWLVVVVFGKAGLRLYEDEILDEVGKVGIADGWVLVLVATELDIDSVWLLVDCRVEVELGSGVWEFEEDCAALGAVELPDGWFVELEEFEI
jgi:hypothetical protein